jgi:hypothetical protein
MDRRSQHWSLQVLALAGRLPLWLALAPGETLPEASALARPLALREGLRPVEGVAVRVGEGDTGPNTGGMGAYSPPPCFTDALRDEVMARIMRPTLDEMAARGTPFTFTLGRGEVIKCWDEGFATMKRGERAVTALGALEPRDHGGEHGPRVVARRELLALQQRRRTRIADRADELGAA